MNEVQAAATVAANSAVAKIMDLIPDLVQYEARKIPAIAIAEKTELDVPVTSPRFTRAYVEPPAQPVSNYAEVLMRSTRWRIGRGEQLGIIWLTKPDTRETLQVEQYGKECSVLRRDDAQPLATWEGGKLKKAGKSCWTQFEPMLGGLDDVVAKLLTKGWVVKRPTCKVVQLTLVEDLKPAAMQAAA